MIVDKLQIKRVLIITLSNIGDIILTTPVLKTVRKTFPLARIDVMAGPQGREIFEKDPAIFKLIIYDKHMPIIEKRRLQLKLKRLKYDLVVDLKNTIFPMLIGPKFRTATMQKFPRSLMHAAGRHLYRLKSLGIEDIDERSYIHIPEEDEEYISALLKKEGVGERMVVISPGAKSHLKRWTGEGFARASDMLIDSCEADVVFIGSDNDKDIAGSVMKRMKRRAHDLVGRTNIRQLAAVLKRAKLLITNDSAPLHAACAVGTKVLAIFGPTDPKRYGPTGEFDVSLAKKLSCSPCEKAVCGHNYECMKSISADEVFDAAKMMLEGYG